MDENSANNLARKLAASWVSYLAGYKGVDRVLNQTPEQIGPFWKEVARQVFQSHATKRPKRNAEAKS